MVSLLNNFVLSLSFSKKLAYQNLHKSKIEFETKYCDEAHLNNNLDELEGTCEHIDGLVENERKLSKQIMSLMRLEPREWSSTLSSAQLKAKSKLYSHVYMTVYKAYVDKRLAYRYSESDLTGLKYVLENFHSLTENLNEKLIISNFDFCSLIAL